MVNDFLFGQSTPDKQKKLQKVEGTLGMPLVSKLLQIVFEVFNDKDQA